MNIKRPANLENVESQPRFEPKRLDLKKRAVRGAAIMGFSQACLFLLRFGSTVVLARFLVPEDFGIVAMASAVMAVLSYAGDLGLSEATIQRPEVSHEQLSTLFWLNVAAGAALMLVNGALAPLLVLLYSDERLLWVTMVLGSEFLLRGVSYQHQAILNRRMEFRAVAVTKIVALILGLILAIGGALWGLGYWSLVILQLVPALVFLCGVWITCDWRPGAFRRKCGLRSLLIFGGNLTAFNFLGALTQSLDKILLGQRWNAHAVGLYSKPYQLVLLSLQQAFLPLARVVVPTLSRLQFDTERYRRYYVKVISLLGYTTIPGLVVLAFLSEEIIVLVLGPGWEDSAVIMRVLCVAALGRPIVDSSNWVCISTGQTKRLVYWALISTPLICLAFLIGIRWGGLGVALAYAIATHCLNGAKLRFLFRASPVHLADIVGASWRPVVLSLAMCPSLYFVKSNVGAAGPLTVALTGGACAAASFALLAWVWPKARAEIRELASNIKMLKTAKETRETLS